MRNFVMLICWVLTLVLIGTLITMLYHYFYKRNINKALKGEKKAFLIDINQLVTYIILLTIFIFNIFILNNIGNLSDHNNLLQSQNNDLKNQVIYNRNEISYIRSLLEEEK